MRIVLVGSGGVGDAFARIAARRSFFEGLVVADYDLSRAEATVAAVREQNPGDFRFVAAQVDASDAESVAALVREHRATHVMNAIDPRFVMPIFNGAFAAGADYLDMAMSLSERHPEEPYSRTGVLLGEEQFAVADEWEQAGRLALVGMGVEPGLSDVFARYASDHLFSEIDELGTRDGSNLTVEGYDFAPSFSIWTTIEECLNPPVIWEKGRGWYVTEPFSEPEIFDFPGGIGPVECVNVEHEEVLLMPRWVDAKRITFKYGLGTEFIDVLKTLRKLGLDKTDPVEVKGMTVSPRDVVAAVLPDPATLGDRMSGSTCAGVWVTGTRQGRPASRGVPVSRGRQRHHDVRVRHPVRGLADRGQSRGCARTAGQRHLVRCPACSARKPSTPSRSSTCSPAATPRRGGWRNARPGRVSDRRR